MTFPRGWRRALGSQIALGAYMQLISWVPLGRWNYQRCCPAGLTQIARGTLSPVDALGALAFLLPLAIFWYAGRRRWRWVAAVAIIPHGVWLALQLVTWWPPYLFGASPRWAAVYARAFVQATQVLPRWGAHLPPDAMHLTLQVLLIGVFITGVKALLRVESAEV